MPPSPAPRRLIGYARVSTEEQATDAQLAELKAAGCQVVHQEHGSGASRTRPVLSRLVREISKGETLVVVRLDRLARSVSHLLEVIEDLEAKGAHFRSLRDPIDTSTPQGVFSLQVLGAVAQLERSLISERTKAGVKAAQAKGKRPGNPGLRAGKLEAVRKTALARDKVYLGDLLNKADSFLPVVRQMRPGSPWQDIVQVLNARGQRWTDQSLRRAVKRLVAEKIAEPGLLGKAGRRPPDDRLMTLIAGIAISNPALTLREIGAQLEGMRERTPRGGREWKASSVKFQLDRARQLGLTVPEIQ